MIEDDLLELKEIEDELLSMSETLDDLSILRIEYWIDVHFGDDLNAVLYIFGAGDPAKECPIYETRLDAEALLAKNNQAKGISCQKLAALFAEDLIHEISSRNIPCVSNEGDAETETYFDLTTPGDKILLPMIR